MMGVDFNKFRILVVKLFCVYFFTALHSEKHISFIRIIFLIVFYSIDYFKCFATNTNAIYRNIIFFMYALISINIKCSIM